MQQTCGEGRGRGQGQSGRGQRRGGAAQVLRTVYRQKARTLSDRLRAEWDGTGKPGLSTLAGGLGLGGWDGPSGGGAVDWETWGAYG